MSDSLRAIGGLARGEFLLGWRSTGFRAAAALCALVAGIACAAEGTTASLAGYLVGRQASTLTGLVALFWMSNTACRDVWIGTDELVMAKPQRTEAILLGRFLGSFALVLLLAVFSLAAGAVVQVTWGGTPFILLAYAHAFARSVVPLLTLSALGFSLCTLFGTPVAGGVVALYWVLVISGRDYVSRVLSFSLTQNAPAYLLLSAGVLALALLAYRPQRRGVPRWPGLLAGGTAVLLVLAVGVATASVLRRHDPPFHRQPGMLAIAGQHLQPDTRMPGFWLPGTDGPRSGLRRHGGKVLAVGLWSPAVRESLPVLDILRRVHDEMSAKGVAALGICISEDTALAGHFARENRCPFPMLLDPGARQTDPPSAGSPVAEAFNANSLPLLVVADRDRVVRYVEAPASAESSHVPEVIRELLSAQP